MYKQYRNIRVSVSLLSNNTKWEDNTDIHLEDIGIWKEKGISVAKITRSNSVVRQDLNDPNYYSIGIRENDNGEFMVWINFVSGVDDSGKAIWQKKAITVDQLIEYSRGAITEAQFQRKPYVYTPPAPANNNVVKKVATTPNNYVSQVAANNVSNTPANSKVSNTPAPANNTGNNTNDPDIPF